MTILFLLLATVASQEATEDVDAFMKKVLENRSVNWERYHDYFGRERARLSIEGSLDETLQGFEREYLWFVKDGYPVRSPLIVDGVAVPPEERERAEAEWIERLQKRERERGPDQEEFFGFEFEPGNFFYAGREAFEGKDLVVIEYYPDKPLWTDDDDAGEEEDEKEAEMEAKFGKVFFVTMLVDPVEHQIVRMTLENTGFDFLPARWLLHLDDVAVSLTMHQPFEGVWLTRDIEGHAKVTTAGGSLELRYLSHFYDYGRTKTGVKYRFPPRGNEKLEKPKP
jgi:hypothetical protein